MHLTDGKVLSSGGADYTFDVQEGRYLLNLPRCITSSCL
jgi:hypothetical protein